MKIKGIDGTAIEYKRWHTGVFAEIILDDDIRILIDETEAANFVTGLRGEQQITVWSDDGQDTLITQQGGTIAIKQKYINQYGGFGIKTALLGQEDATKIADDIQYMIDNPDRMD